MKLLINQIFTIDLSQGDRGFPYIGDQRGIADIESVKLLKAACESHLAIFDQEEIDDTNKAWDDERRRENEEKARTEPIEKKPPRCGFIYFMRNNRNGFTKIGFSQNLKQRERTLQAEDPDTEVVFFFEGIMLEEEMMHERFASKRVRGEWFRLDPEDIAQLKTEVL